MKDKILLIIPAYNEEKNILDTCSKILEFNKLNKTSYDLIVINDGSKDQTAKICKDNKIPHINLVHNLGIGGAVQTGYKYALENGYDIAVQFDGDGQHDVSCVSAITSPIINKEADFVIGSRFIEKKKDNFQSSLARRFGIKIITFFIKLTTKEVVKDTTSGFRAVNRKIIEQFAHQYPVEYPEPITTAILLHQHFKFKEISVDMHERAGGTSSIKAWKTVYYMVNVIITILTISLRRYQNAD